MSDTSLTPLHPAASEGRWSYFRHLGSWLSIFLKGNGTTTCSERIGQMVMNGVQLAPYAVAAMAPLLILGGPGSAADTIVISFHTLFLMGLVAFALWLLYKVLTSVIYAVVALVVIGVILLQLHVIPAQDIPFKMAPI